MVSPRRHHRGPVWTLIELTGGVIHPASLQMLGGGCRLADHLGVELGAVVLGRPGRNVREAAMEAVAYGASTAYVMEDKRLSDYRDDVYGQALALLIGLHFPQVLLLGATESGRHLAGRMLAFGLAANCTIHTVPPLPASLPERKPDRAGHMVLEPLPLLHAGAELKRPTLVLPTPGKDARLATPTAFNH